MVHALLFAGVLLLTPLAAFAALEDPFSLTWVPRALEVFVRAFIYVATPVAAALLVWGGFKLVAAQGKPDKIRDARQWLLKVGLGVVVLVALWAIATIIGNTIASLSLFGLAAIVFAWIVYLIVHGRSG